MTEETFILRLNYGGNPEVVIDAPITIGGVLTKQKVIDHIRKNRPEVKSVEIIPMGNQEGLN